MATNFPALRGRFGSTEYFLLTMKVGDIITQLKVPKDMEGWEDLSPEEKFQREINYKRVREQIAPYLANDPDRFIGSFIVTVKNAENMVFESFEEAGIKVPSMLGATFASEVGILTFNGGQLMIPLDGQHRLAALQFAIQGKDEKGNEIPGIDGSSDLANETCSVILVRDDLEKSRKIFNKVNRYAKPTSKADNLITGDDDVCAVISRELIVTNLIGSRLVKMGSGNTIPAKATEFTTLGTVYEISLSILSSEANGRKKLNTQSLPSAQTIRVYKQVLEDFWRGFLRIKPYEVSIFDRTSSGDSKRQEARDASLLCRPIVMRALAEAYIRLRNVPEGAARISLDEFVERVNGIDWAPDNPQWINILVQPGNRVITGPAAMMLAAQYIAFMLGEKLESYAVEKLTERLSSLGVPFPEQAY